MSNAKRRHRRQRRRRFRWAEVRRIEAQWASEGYALTGEFLGIRVWERKEPMLVEDGRRANVLSINWIEEP